ncbi:hypothetical protein HDU91_005375 [Kappamyces sp. JEL0680]|nr:hypothetical protein HDU91_005375 [Kappamyces sp. JEL0680]
MQSVEDPDDEFHKSLQQRYPQVCSFCEPKVAWILEDQKTKYASLTMAKLSDKASPIKTIAKDQAARTPFSATAIVLNAWIAVASSKPVEATPLSNPNQLGKTPLGFSLGFTNSPNLRLDSNPNLIHMKMFSTQAFGPRQPRTDASARLARQAERPAAAINLKAQRFFAKEDDTGIEDAFGSRFKVVTENFHNNSAPKEVPTPAPVHTSAVGRMSMPSFESAAQITAPVAGSSDGTSYTHDTTCSNRKLQQVVLDDDAEPKDHRTRMLEAQDLDDEVTIDLLINKLCIPLPSTQTVASRKEIIFPARQIGYLMQQLLEHKLFDRLRELLGHVMKGSSPPR